MFLTEKKNSNGLYYLYLMDSSWDPAAKRTKIRIVESFGKVDDFKREKPAQYAELVEKYGNKKNRYQAEKEHALRKFITRVSHFNNKVYSLLSKACSYKN